MGKQDSSWDEGDGDSMPDKGIQPDAAKLKVTKEGTAKQKVGGLNSGLKRKPIRNGIAKAPVAKVSGKKGF